jgi:hypothetical protein
VVVVAAGGDDSCALPLAAADCGVDGADAGTPANDRPAGGRGEGGALSAARRGGMAGDGDGDGAPPPPRGLLPAPPGDAAAADAPPGVLAGVDALEPFCDTTTS